MPWIAGALLCGSGWCAALQAADGLPLERWGVSGRARPAGSRIVNRLPTIWEEHKWHVAVAVAALLLQSALILMLLIQRRLKRRAEGELARMVERYDLAARAAHLAVWDWDVTGDHLVWDERMFELYGGERADFQGTAGAWLQRVHPDDRANWQEATRQALAGERELDTAFQVRRPDGEVRILRVYGKVARDSQGRPLRMTGINYDITEHRRSEAAQRQQLSRLDQLNHITRAIAERQESGSMLRVVLKHLVVEFPVEAALVALGDREAGSFTVTVQECRSEPGAGSSAWGEGTLLRVEDSGLDGCLSGRTLLVRDTAAGESTLERELARSGIGSLVAAPLVAGERFFGILLALRREPDGFAAGEVEFMRQLSEHLALAVHHAQLYENLRVAYEQLKTTQRVVMQQERLRALGQMSSGIAHDVNNALSPIVMNAELILLREKNLGDQSRQSLRLIQLAASDIEHTVARMREFYRSREDQQQLLPLDLNAEVRAVISLTQPRWRDMPQRTGVSIEVATRLQSSLPLIPGIGSEVREALTNLILNAVDAMPSGGTITIGTELIGGSTAERRCVALWVRDTGVGMDDETKARCLEPFYTKKGERGTGLGLSMVYGIAQRHHAAIEIESAPGLGTAFRLVFPVSAAAPPQSVAAPVPTRYAGPRLHILCIDDEPLMREGLRDILTVDGHAVECAEGGRAGLEAFRSARERGEPFQLVITDLGMPHVDGKEVAQAIHAEAPGTPVILLTGWGEQMKSDGAHPAGVALILSKPPKILELWRAIAKVAAGQQPPGAQAGRTEDEGTAGEPAAAVRGTVLIMDDDETVHMLAARAFHELGYVVDCATNGPRTLELYGKRLAEGKPYAAVFLDLNIPGGPGGVEVAALLRETDPSAKLFVASGADDDAAVLNYEQYGFCGAVAKPMRLKDLAAAVLKFQGA